MTDEESAKKAAKAFSPQPMEKWSARRMLGLPPMEEIEEDRLFGDEEAPL